MKAAGQIIPGSFVESIARVKFAYALIFAGQVLAECFVGQRTPARAKYREVVGQQAVASKVI